jgi:beta-N-acetylhexosaminidase
VRRLSLVGLGVAVAAAFGGVTVARESASRDRPPPARASAPGRPAARGAGPVAGRPRAQRTAARISSLSLAQLAGQRVIYAYSGLTPPATLLSAVRAGEAAGVIFFAPNISSVPQLRSVIARLQGANASSAVPAPLLMLVDQEGGAVRRLPGAPVLSEQQIGASGEAAQLAAAAGTGAGENLRIAGLNVNLAPVLDVARSAAGFDGQYGRSYGPSAATDAGLGAAFVTAQQRTGVAATAKHFPGLGTASAEQDTDAAPVTLDVSLGQLRAVDETPFRAAIAAGVKLVMLSWATYPALDPGRPAALSSTVVDGELRGRLRFRGVTITDGLTAGALTAYGGVGTRGVLAAKAGDDLLLASATIPSENSPSEGLAVLHALEAALRNGSLSAAADEQSVARILALRQHP